MGLIPVVIDKENNVERSYDIFSRLLKDRIIFISGEIDDNLANSVVAELLYLDTLEKNNVLTYRTDILGHVVFYSDGDTIFTTKDYKLNKK